MHYSINRNSASRGNNVVWLVVLVAFVILGFLLFRSWGGDVGKGLDESVTIRGNFSCLPLKPEMEGVGCTLGIRDKEGMFYALDTSNIQDANTDLKAEDDIAVTGFVRPEEEINSSEWSKFDIKAIIKVNTLLRTK